MNNLKEIYKLKGETVLYIAKNKTNNILTASVMMIFLIICFLITEYFSPIVHLYEKDYIKFILFDTECFILITIVLIAIISPLIMFIKNKLIITQTAVILKGLTGQKEIPIEEITNIRIFECNQNKYTQIETKERFYGYPFPVNILEINNCLKHINPNIKYF